jgi:hypothetical protein
MSDQDQGPTETGAGFTGTLKLIAIVAALLLAMLAAGFVLDLVPREMIGDFATKVVLLTGIVAVLAVLVGALMGRSKR